MTKVLLLAACLFTFASAPLMADPVKITLLGVGDVYNFAGDGTRGGFARLNAVAKSERAANPNMLYLFDGDMLSPSLLSGFDKGQNTIDLTNLVPFDLAVPGNHEFDFGPGNFAEKMAASDYPWAAINITTKEGVALPGLGGVVVKDISGVKIALIPVAQDTSADVSNTGDLVFLPTVETAIKAARQAREDGADLVIGVVQTDLYNDLKLVRSKAFDVVLSGDDHSYGTFYDGITAYVETSIDARMLAPLDLTVTVSEKGGRRVVGWTPSFRFIDTANVTPDPETQLLVDGFQKQLDATLNVVIGTLQTPLDSRRNVVRGSESTMGNLITDAMRMQSDADVALMNAGGIRADRTYDAGATLTRRDVLTELPFGNTLAVVEISGAQLQQVLENGVSQVETGAGRFLQVSGLSLVYDAKAAVGARVTKVMVAGTALDPAKTYKVAINDYMMAGGDGFKMLKDAHKITNTGAGALVATVVMAYVEQQGKVQATVEGRITALGQ